MKNYYSLRTDTGADSRVTNAAQAILNIIADSLYERIPEPITPPGLRLKPETETEQAAEPTQRFKCFPNPSNGNLTVSGTGISGSTLEVIELSTGRIIHSYRLTRDELLISAISPGSYLIRLKHPDYTEYQKLIVIR